MTSYKKKTIREEAKQAHIDLSQGQFNQCSELVIRTGEFNKASVKAVRKRTTTANPTMI
jgi:hypothetical protein